jgi:hypothetical protein
MCKKKIGIQDTQERKHEVRPHTYFPPKLLWRISFYRNFKGIYRIQSFIPNALIGKLSTGIESSKKFLYFSFNPKKA